MPCYHPLKGFIVGVNDNGKKDIKIVPYDTEFLYKPFGSDIFERHPSMDPEFLLRLSATGRVIQDWIPIPCGQCVGCRIEYSKQWATRCMLESTYHDSNYFITLTYDDEHIYRKEYVDDYGEILINNGTLVKKDLQTFNKRLRDRLYNYYGEKFRFYACGEYGSNTARPHYHMIAFGLVLRDLQLYKKSSSGFDLYTSPLLNDCWGKGYVVVGDVTYESCAYVSRYIMKKQKGDNAAIYDKYNIEPEFTLMSRKPGIGKQYFDDNFNKLYPSDNIVLPGGKLVKPPRYFDNLMSAIDEDLLNDVKANRCRIAQEIQDYKADLSTADYQMQLRHAENNKTAQLKKLVRTIE